MGAGKANRVEFDAWDLETESSYSLENFYTGSTNHHDHSTTIRVKVPNHVSAKIEEVVKTFGIPEYKTTHDFHRDADIHRLKWLSDRMNNPDFTGWVGQELLVIEVEQMRRKRTEWLRVIAETEEFLKELTESRDVSNIESVLDKMTIYAATLPEPYNAKLLTALSQYRLGPRSI